jgi:predicted HicB family RNase H-like nuclease
MAQQKEGFRTYLLRNVPIELHERAIKKAETQGRSLRVQILLLLEKYVNEDK